MRKYLKDHIVRSLTVFSGAVDSTANYGLPLDTHLRDYCNQYKSRIPLPYEVGARDRKELKDTVYNIVRHRIMLEKLVKDPSDYESMIQILHSEEFDNKRKNPSFEEYFLDYSLGM